MARKAKVVAPVVAEEVVDQVVESIEVAEEEVVVEPTGPSVLSSMIQQVAEAPKAVEPGETKKAEKNEGVGLFIKHRIAQGMSNKDILALVHEQYGNKNTTYACVAWYRNKMKKAGAVQQVKTNVEWLQNFAKANGLSEESTAELGKAMRVA